MIVDHASLSADSESHGLVAVIGAFSLNNAQIDVEEVGGSPQAADVALDGTLIGLGGEVGYEFFGEINLELPEDEMVASDIFGNYSGTFSAVEVMAGPDFLDVTNAAGCRITVSGFSIGMGAESGAALLSLRLTGDFEYLDD